MFQRAESLPKRTFQQSSIRKMSVPNLSLWWRQRRVRKDTPHASCVCVRACVCVCATQRANTQEPRAPAFQSRLGDRSGVRGANQAPGTGSQAPLLVAAPPGFSPQKGKGGESQAEGLLYSPPPHPTPPYHLLPPRQSAASG